ncbi:MAG TPA: Npt1/Npt2 family nucleotide transporter [Candidatus Babeliales bacterium]|nr:Npt1/Npt2 family nucleotide transporter [Candidatus Babeliales bacterium]
MGLNSSSFDMDKAREEYRGIKLFLLMLAFFFLIGGYTLIRELKDSIFVAIVGKEYIPWAKQFTFLVMIPMVFLYAKLVDRLRRYQLMYVAALFFGLLGLVVTYFLGHPTIGLANTAQSQYRLFGWFVYFAFESYSPFLVSVFWAFANSVSSPKEAKEDYALLISGSKISGALVAFGAWYLLGLRNYCSDHLYFNVVVHQVLLGFGSLLVLVIPFIIFALMKKVPGWCLHGYEAVYQLEKEKKSKGQEKTGMLAGLKMFLKYPYILGIFGMIFFYEVLNVVLNYQRISIANEHAADIGELSRSLFGSMFFMHLIGFFIAIFGTRAIIKRLGEKRSLMFIPISAGILIFGLMSVIWFSDIWIINIALGAVYIVFRSINYAFTYPLRESLYIPTVKELKFKSKSWIDAFGQKLAKSMGSNFNLLALQFGQPGTVGFLLVYSVFFGGIIGLWIIVAYMLGNRYEQAVRDNEVIGAQVQD